MECQGQFPCECQGLTRLWRKARGLTCWSLREVTSWRRSESALRSGQCMCWLSKKGKISSLGPWNTNLPASCIHTILAELLSPVAALCRCSGTRALSVRAFCVYSLHLSSSAQSIVHMQGEQKQTKHAGLDTTKGCNACAFRQQQHAIAMSCRTLRQHQHKQKERVNTSCACTHPQTATL